MHSVLFVQVYRSAPILCPGGLRARAVESLESARILQDACAEFYYSTRLKRRTYLYFRGSPPAGNNPHEITLMTMFTLDRQVYKSSTRSQ